MLPEDRYLEFLLTLDQARIAAEEGRVAVAHLYLHRGLEVAHTVREPWGNELRALYRQALDSFQARYPWPIGGAGRPSRMSERAIPVPSSPNP